MVDQKTAAPTSSLPKPKGKGEKKWLVGGLIGFVVILLVTAVMLLFQIKKPVEPLPSPRPRPSPTIPTVKQVEGEDVCEMAFVVEAPLPLTCYEECDPAGNLCSTEYECRYISGIYRCVNPECETEVSCICPKDEKLGCFEKCSEDGECEAGLYCITVPGTNDKRCVDKECPDDIDCVCDKDLVACFGECESDDDCSGDNRCMIFPGTSQLRCLNPECTSETDCSCPIEGPTPTPTSISTPTPPTKGTVAEEPTASPRAAEPELPEAGGSLPVILGASTGLLLILAGLLLF